MILKCAVACTTHIPRKTALKFFIDNWTLFLIALTSGGLLLWPLIKGAMETGLSTAAAVQLINREKGVMIDVSSADEFAAAHAIGSKNIPLDQLDAKLPNLVKNKALPLIFIGPQSARTQKASAQAKALGYENAQVLAGGLQAWREANLPIESSAAPVVAKITA